MDSDLILSTCLISYSDFSFIFKSPSEHSYILDKTDLPNNILRIKWYISYEKFNEFMTSYSQKQLYDTPPTEIKISNKLHFLGSDAQIELKPIADNIPYIYVTITFPPDSEPLYSNEPHRYYDM